MEEFVKVAKVGDIPPGERAWFDFEEETVVVFNVDGKFYAIADVCTHDGGPVGHGPLDGYTIVCPRHGACFDIRNGDVLAMPAVVPVPAYRTRVEGEDLYLENPDAW